MLRSHLSAEAVPVTELFDDTLRKLLELAGSITYELTTLRLNQTTGALLAESSEHAYPINFNERVTKFKKSLVAVALASSGGNQAVAARRLGLKPTTLHEMIKRWEIEG